MTFIKNILALFFLLFSCVLLGQQTLVFQQLKGENASTQSITYAIKQDSIGNVWIASEEGVLKHNSNYYKVYNSYNGLPESLNNRVSQLFIDSKQRVWAGLEKGVCVYNSNKDKFDLIGNNDEVNPSLISSFDEDANHNIWIGGYNGLFYGFK